MTQKNQMAFDYLRGANKARTHDDWLHLQNEMDELAIEANEHLNDLQKTISNIRVARMRINETMEGVFNK